jgi:chemotaxis protein histidine kinase CheA
MRRKIKWQLPLIFVVICFFVLQPGFSLLPGQTTDPVKEKKEKKKKKEIVITDEDLKQFHPKKKKDSKTKKKAAEKTKSKTKPKAKPTPPVKEKIDPKQTEKYWRSRKATLDKNIATAKANLDKMQKRLNLVHSLYLRETRPMEYNKLQSEYNQLRESVKIHKLGIASLEEQLEELWDEARKAGAERGWLR